MTKIELLFMETTRTDCITYEEFSHAGWSRKEYYTYLSFCDEIRAGVICIEDIRRKARQLSKINISNDDLYNDLLSPFFTNFLKWFYQYIEQHNINLSYQALRLFTEKRYGDSKVIYPSNNSLFNERTSIYISFDDFRYNLECLIGYYLLHNTIELSKEYEDYTEDELIKEKKELEVEYSNNFPPDTPENMNSYAEIQNWASKYVDYEYIEHKNSDDIDYINEELERRKKTEQYSHFNFTKNTLYVYTFHPKCTQEHNVKSVTAIVVSLNGRRCELNISYCLDCDRFYISFDEYEMYMKKYEFLPIKFVKVSSHYNDDYYNRSEESTLKMCGYTVKEGVLSTKNRHDLLSYLIDCSILTKSEIINHLDYLINTNGKKSSNYFAVKKWREDMEFVSNYKINIQTKVNIDKIISASKNIKQKINR